MHTHHREDELIITLESKEQTKFKEFLKTLNITDGVSEDMREMLLGRDHEGKKHDPRGIHQIELSDGAQLIVIAEKPRWYVFLKKNKQFDKLRDLFFKHVPFPDAKR